MPWITLLETDVKTALNNAELQAYRTKLAADQDDPLPTLIADVVAEVRGYVAARHPIEAEGIPHALKNAALDLIVYRLAKRCHVEPEKQRKDAADDAVKLLVRVAEGKHGLELLDSAMQTGSWGSEAKLDL